MTRKELYHKDLEDERWQLKRKEVLAFYRYTCMGCGERNVPLHIHHPRYRNGKDGEPLHAWEYMIWELVPYCADCHAKIHGKDIEEGDIIPPPAFLPPSAFLPPPDRSFDTFPDEIWDREGPEGLIKAIKEDIPDLKGFELYQYIKRFDYNKNWDEWEAIDICADIGGYSSEECFDDTKTHIFYEVGKFWRAKD